MPDPFWRGVSVGLFLASVFLCALTATFVGSGLPVVVEALAGAVAGAACYLLARVAVRLLRRPLARVPAHVWLSATAAGITLFVLRWLRFRWPADLYYPAAAVFLLAQGVLVGGLWARGRIPGKLLLVLLGAAIAVDVLGIAWLASDGHDPYPIELSAETSEQPEPLDLPNPGEPGAHGFTYLTYGSGTDRRREEFAEGADWTSPTVDVSAFLPEWKGFKAWAREWYWGFSLEQAPLNGRVWLPEGEGPFPLVLVVHGNHSMEEHSDPGYAYLGELLASRGFITVSIDENYINGTWSGDFRGREMPLRGVLLLEHLKLWREWSEARGHTVEGKVDLGRIALAGHSRGGEAVAIAAAFNRLPHYPDDATLAFDYGFDIRALVAIAQTDARYPRRLQLDGVSFLALQGSYDSDEASFFGMRQLRRVALGGGDPYRFKSGIYIHRANHGQFNSIWGRTDAGPPYSWLLNLAPLIPGEDQRRIAEVFISAFLEATLHERLDYVPLFRDPRLGSPWLPEARIVEQFEDTRFEALATFEEDLDVTTATFAGSRVETGGLSKWREEELLYRNDEKQGTSAVVLGWDEPGAEYAISFSSEPVGLEEGSYLRFSLGTSVEAPSEESDGAEASDAVDLSVVVEDASGRSAALPLLEIGPPTPPLRVRFLKLERWNDEAHGPAWEPALRQYDVPFERFAAENPELDPSRLGAIRFRFDRTPAGVVILDDVGIRQGPPGPETDDAVLTAPASEGVELMRDEDELGARDLP